MAGARVSSAGCLQGEVARSPARVPSGKTLQEVLDWGTAEGWVRDGALATSDAQRAAFWHPCEEQPEAQRLKGPQLKHDISVPPGRIAALLAKGDEICGAFLPGTRINPFRLLAGDTIPYNLYPPGAPDFSGLGPAFAAALARLSDGMRRSFAAELEPGRSKIALAAALRPLVKRGLMARIKRLINPGCPMNPGVILAEDWQDQLVHWPQFLISGGTGKRQYPGKQRGARR